MENKPLVSIVMPAYNEEGVISRVLDELEVMGGFHEIIVVNDGSSDRTAEVVTTEHPNVQLVNHPYNIGNGAAVKSGIRAMIVPGSGLVRAQAEKEGLLAKLEEAGFDFRLAGCSMCLGMNPDQLVAGERCASTSNRNFMGRQGPGGRTHLVSPAMAAAAAVTGRLTDVREL